MIHSPILLIDDEPVINAFYSRALEAVGYNVTTALTGSDGIDIIHDIRPELVITDIMMPGMNGYELCERLRRADEKKIPILFLTANDGLKVIHDGLAAGGDDFLYKGPDISALRKRIDFWLNATLHSLPDIPRQQALEIVDREMAQTHTQHKTPIADLQNMRPETKNLMIEKITTLAYASKEYDFTDDKVALPLLGFLSGAIEAFTVEDLLLALRYPDFLEAVLIEMDPRWELKVRALYSTFNQLSREPEFREAQAWGRRAAAAATLPSS